MAEKVHSFAIGDYVKYVRHIGQDKDARNPYVGHEGHITSISFHSNSGTAPEYGFEGSAWHSHDCFELIRRATAEDLLAVRKAMRDEDDDDWSDEEEETTGLNELVEWFAELDKRLTVSVADAENNQLRVTADTFVLGILNKNTTWELKLPERNTEPGSVQYVWGRNSALAFTYVDKHEVLICVGNADGTKMDHSEMTNDLLNEYDPFGI